MSRSNRRRGRGLLRALNLPPFLPPARRAPLYARVLWALASDPRVPASRKALLGLAGAYIVSPFDLVPEWIPFLGAIDDVAVMVLAVDVFIEGVAGGKEGGRAGPPAVGAQSGSRGGGEGRAPACPRARRSAARCPRSTRRQAVRG